MTYHSKDAMAMQLAFEHKNWPAVKMFAKRIIEDYIDRLEFKYERITVDLMPIQSMKLSFEVVGEVIKKIRVNEIDFL